MSLKPVASYKPKRRFFAVFVRFESSAKNVELEIANVTSFNSESLHLTTRFATMLMTRILNFGFRTETTGLLSK